MSVFCAVLQKVYDLDVYLPTDKNLQNKINEKDQVSLFLHQFIIDLNVKTKHFTIPKKESSSVKLKKIKEILENPFFRMEDRDTIFDLFSKAQKIMFAFSKFVNMYKIKKMPIKIQTDLLLNDIDISKKNVFIVLQHSVKYPFIINDLINIITTNLSNCSFFFAEPLEIKNPYNNVPLNKATLYSLYFFIKENLFSMPLLFDLYFHSNFDINSFKINNENYIREIYIKNFARRSHFNILYWYLMAMFEEYYEYMPSISIDRNFPREKLINIMRPYLQLYLLGKYLIIGCEKRYITINLLKKKLLQFSKHNPMFGRKIITQQIMWGQSPPSPPFIFRYPVYKNVVEFNADCISFHDDSIKISEIELDDYEDESIEMDDYDP